MSGKETSSEKPSWVNINMVDSSKTTQQNTIDMLNSKYGINNWLKGAGKEYNQIVKWIVRYVKYYSGCIMVRYFYLLEFTRECETKDYVNAAILGGVAKKCKKEDWIKFESTGFKNYGLDSYKIIKFGVQVPSKDFKKDNVILF